LLLVFDRDDIMFVFGGLMYVFDLFTSVNGGLVGLHLLPAHVVPRHKESTKGYDREE
jgi:hypothetical protein